jgi:regulatory protein
VEKDAAYKEALSAITRYCSKGEKCKDDVLKKLKNYSLDESQINQLVSFLEEEGYINELRYAKALINDRLYLNHWGKIKIYQALKAKKVEEHIIQSSLEEISRDEYISILVEELQKKIKNLDKALPPYILQYKLYQFAYQRGFEQDIITKALSRLKN